MNIYENFDKQQWFILANLNRIVFGFCHLLYYFNPMSTNSEKPRSIGRNLDLIPRSHRRCYDTIMLRALLNANCVLNFY